MEGMSEKEMQVQIIASFKRRGVTMQSDALECIVRQLRTEENPKQALSDIVRQVMEYLQRQAQKTNKAPSVVDRAAIDAVLAIATRDDDDVKATAFSVVSAFHTPKYGFDPSSRTHFPIHAEKTKFSLHADANSKLAIFEERLHLVMDRLMRNPIFAPPPPGSKRVHVPLKRVDDLSAVVVTASSSSSSSSSFADGHPSSASIPVTMCGVLTQPEDGLYCLEDHSNAVALDLRSITKQYPGLFTEGCVIVIEGEYYPDEFPPGFETRDSVAAAASAAAAAAVAAAAASAQNKRKNNYNNHQNSHNNNNNNYNNANTNNTAVGAGGNSASGGMSAKFTPLTERIAGVVRVSLLTLPPAEEREVTLRAMSVVDPFRVFNTPQEFSRAKTLLLQSPEATGTMIAILSDVHLDKPEVLENLRVMLGRFRDYDSIPAMFVLMGNFMSTPYGQHAGDSALYRAAFDALAKLLGEFPEVCTQTHFVFVPGPTDPGSGAVIPRAPLPASVVASLLNNEALPQVTFTSNPCRVRFFTQEIVLFRQELSLRFRRRAVVPPLPSPPAFSVSEHLSRTIMDQGHLCPLPLSAQPIYWDYDSALRLTPAPHAVVIAEDEDQYTHIHENSNATVCNPGSFAKDGNFIVYRPAAMHVELSSMKEEEEVIEGEEEEREEQSGGSNSSNSSSANMEDGGAGGGGGGGGSNVMTPSR